MATASQPNQRPRRLAIPNARRPNQAQTPLSQASTRQFDIDRPLVILDAAAPVATWNDPAAWRPSYAIGGSPAADDTPALDGDLNGDLRVDLLDLAILQANLGTLSGATRASGDLNGDAKVTVADAAILSRNFGRTAPSPVPSAPAAIVREARSQRADGDGIQVPARRLHAVRRPYPAAVDVVLESLAASRERSGTLRTADRRLAASAN
ncbi:MAG TPA: hypothetical protein GX405_09500 [Rhizobiales bacterium]|nr:hypothetical protein [Hyphomicrobiales bacterium]